MKPHLCRYLFFTMGFLSFFGLTHAADKLKVGDPAPVLEVTTEENTSLDLGQVYGKGTTLVYFYPKADTPGCTKQACSLRDAYAVLEDKGVTVLGVSTDKPAAQKKFKEKFKLPFTLIADPEGKVLEAFGVPNLMGFAARQAFLIQGSKIVWVDFSASTGKQADDVLAFLKTQS